MPSNYPEVDPIQNKNEIDFKNKKKEDMELWNHNSTIKPLDKYKNVVNKKVLSEIQKGNIGEDYFYQKYNLLRTKWLGQIDEEHYNNPFFVLQLILRNCNINSFDSTKINKKINLALLEITSILNIYKRLRIDDERIYVDINKMLEMLYYAQKSVYSLFRVRVCFDESYDSYANDDHHINKFDIYERNTQENLSSAQKLLLYLLDCVSELNWRKNGSDCFSPIYTEYGNYTYSWKKELAIEDFVYKYTSKDYNFAQFQNATDSRSNLPFVIDYLTHCKDSQFPDIERDRHIFSFSNGVYMIKNYDEDTKLYSDKFVTYKEEVDIPDNLTAAKYFDQYFDDQDTKHDDWYNIPTPNVQKILDYQFSDNKEKEAICRWMYIFMGRMLYNVGDLDGWQVIGFIKGVAGTGKGTLLSYTIKHFYEASDVGILSNNSEKQFGLMGFYDKFMFIAPEIKGDLSLEQATFQSMVSGEDVSIARKFKDPEQKLWTTPGFLAGNEVPEYTDNSGSLSRRLIIWQFLKKVSSKHSDPLLNKKIKAEMPLLIQKCVKGYLQAVNNWGKRNIWDVLPKYFHSTRDDIAKITNPFYGLVVVSGKLTFGEYRFIKESDFKNEFQNFCRENNIPQPKGRRVDVDAYRDSLIVAQDRFNTKIFIKNFKRVTPFRFYYNDGTSEEVSFKGVYIFGMTSCENPTPELDKKVIKIDGDFGSFMKI
jgi:hypothetical protein